METVEEKLGALSIARRSHPEEPSYLLDLSMQPCHSGSAQGRLIAVSCSDFSVHLHDRDTLKLLGDFKGHGGALCGVTFAHASPDLLYSASADGTVRTWDVRRPDTEAVRVFKSDPSHHYCSFDLSCSDLVLCAGTEQVTKEDSFLVFWDARVSGKMDGTGGGSSDGTLLGVYSESHSDDITQVRFHPRDKDRLASGSTDGLVNVFDLSLGGEDEALLATCNSGSSASSVCWSGKDYTQLLCLSHDEGLQLWDLSQLDTEEPLTLYSTVDARSLSLFPGSEEESVDYLVGGQWMEEAQRLVVVAGTNSGDLHLLDCDGRGLRLLRSLRRGHAATVRCFLWDTGSAGEVNLVTGGEDGQLLLWKPGGEELIPGKRESMKCDSALKVKSRLHKKHDTGIRKQHSLLVKTTKGD